MLSLSQLRFFFAGDVCGSLYTNPCQVGTCRNTGDGSYVCICPPSFYSGTKTDGTATCAPTFNPREWYMMAFSVLGTCLHYASSFYDVHVSLGSFLNA